MYSLLFEGASSLTGSKTIIRQMARLTEGQTERLTEVNVRLRFLSRQPLAMVVLKESFQ